MVRVLFLFLACFHVNVARSNGNLTWHAFQSYGAMLRFLWQRQYFEDLFNENGGVFSYDKNRLLPQNYKKNALFFLLVWFMCILQKRQSVQWPHSTSIITQKNTRTKETKKLPVACQSAMGQAKIFPSIINACILCIRVLCKTQRSFIQIFVSS